MNQFSFLISTQSSHFKVLFIAFIFIVIMGLRGSATNYYSQISGYANLTAVWGINEDGTGTNPINFTTAGDFFILRAESTLDLNSNWIIGMGVTLEIDGNIYVAGNDHDITINGTVIFTKASGNQVNLVGSGDGNNFTLGDKATLKTSNSYGICGLNCSLPAVVSGTIVLPITANYEFNGTAQAMSGLPQTINNLTLSGSGLKTSNNTDLTINGILSMEGTATISFLPKYSTSATLQYNTSSSRVAGVEWMNTFTAIGGVLIKNTGIITLNSQKQFGSKINIPLNISSESTLKTDNFKLTFYGNFINNGTLEAGSSEISFTGPAAIESIDGFTTTGKVSINKSIGKVTLHGNICAGDLIIDGTELNLGTGHTHKVTGICDISNCILNGGSSTLILGGTFSIRGGNFDSENGTVEFCASVSQQTCPVLNYNNLTLSGSGIKTFANSPTVNGILSMGGTATIKLTSGFLIYGTNATLQYNSTNSSTTSAEWISPFSATGGVVIANTMGSIKMDRAKIFNDSVPFTIKSGATLNALTYSNTFSSTSIVTINGTIQTADSAGFSRAIGATISSKNNPKILLGNSSTIEYNGVGVQSVSDGTYNNLTISGTSGTKSIRAGSSVTVKGALITNGMLSIESDIANSGSLIVNGTSTGNVTYNRWLDHSNTSFPIAYPGYSRWYITSAPVNVSTNFNSAANIGKIHIDASATPKLYDFAKYSESENDWLYSYKSSSIANIPGALIPGEGYLISLNTASNGIIQFNGILNDGPITKSVTTSANKGWNAVGNPYTSAIKIVGGSGSGSFLHYNTNNLNLDYAAIYVWNEDAAYTGEEQYYRVIGNSGYNPSLSKMSDLKSVSNIQVGQGFLIRVKSPTPPEINSITTITFNKEMQVHDSGLSLKSAEVSWPGITLLAESNGQTRSTVVAFNANMTTGLDVTYDAGLLASDYFQIYTHLVGGGNKVDFAIQCLPDNQYKYLSVPLGIDLPEGGDLVLRADGILLPDGVYPVIEDKVLGIKTELKTESDSYFVTLAKNTAGIGRFYLSFGSIALLNPKVLLEKKYTASFIKDLIVINGAVEPGTKAQLFDISGIKLGEYPLMNMNRNEIIISGLRQHVYILKIESKNYKQVLKLLSVNY